MKTMPTSDAATYARLFVKDRAVANRYWARCMGQDAAMDDETVAMIKEFLSDKLSDKDHTKVCSMLDGDVEAQDNEPAPQFRRLPDGTVVESSTAEDSKADFHRRYPGLAAIRIDNSGIPLPARAARHSAADAASFAAMFPDAARIRIL